MKNLKCILTVAVAGSILLSIYSGTCLASTMAGETIPDHSIQMVNAAADVNSEGIAGFVTRLYNVCLDRNPDQVGLNSWVEQLTNKTATGCSAAYGFIFSNEFQSKNCSNTEYVTYMYSAFFGRTPDAAGLNDWVSRLDAGATRESVFCGFANSNEFGQLCASFGVVRGFHIEGFNYSQVAQVNLFIDRLYSVILQRDCDNVGMADWTTQLLTGPATGYSVANGFLNSQEYLARNQCDDCFIETLYNAFMGRGSDQQGLMDWQQKLLYRGYERNDVIIAFANSAEFRGICESYGINPGNVAPRFGVSTEINPSMFINTSNRNNLDLVTWAWNAYRHEWGYVWGSYGQIATDGEWAGRRIVDCGGLIKSYFWYDFATGTSQYYRNGFREDSSETMYSHATVKGDLSTMPELPGLGLWTPGHVGIYIGNGQVIDAQPGCGVQIREFEDFMWEAWFEIPGLIYVDAPQTSAPTEVPPPAFEQCQNYGELVTLGNYGGEDIQWRVIDYRDGNYMLISDKIIAAHRFNPEGAGSTWATSEIRTWLNGEFYNTAFTADEQNRILYSAVPNDRNIQSQELVGTATQDYVFLLSTTEAYRLFASNDARVAYNTEYARTHGMTSGPNEYTNWWLRTAGVHHALAGTDVMNFGGIYEDGSFPHRNSMGVRPVIWVSSIA